MTWLRKKTSSIPAARTKSGGDENASAVVAPTARRSTWSPRISSSFARCGRRTRPSMPASGERARGVGEGRVEAERRDVHRSSGSRTPLPGRRRTRSRANEPRRPRRAGGSPRRGTLRRGWFRDFDYQVPVFERALSGVPENASESGRREVLRLDAPRLRSCWRTGTTRFRTWTRRRRRAGAQRILRANERRNDEAGEAGEAAPRKICRPPKRVSSPTPSRSIEKYPRCEECGELPDVSLLERGARGAGPRRARRDSVRRCVMRVAVRRRLVSIAPGHVPGDAHDFRVDRGRAGDRCSSSTEPESRDRHKPRRFITADVPDADAWRSIRRRRRRAGRARMAQPQTFRRVWSSDARRVRGGNRGGGASYL